MPDLPPDGVAVGSFTPDRWGGSAAVRETLEDSIRRAMTRYSLSL